MARPVLGGLLGKRILKVVLLLLAYACVQVPAAMAQHAGGHFGGGGVRIFTPPIGHVPMYRGPIAYHAIAPLHLSYASPVGEFGSGGLLARWRPVRPYPIAFPIYGYPWLFGSAFWWFGPGWQYTSCWWATCGLLWNFQFGYNGLPFYEYAPEFFAYPEYQYEEGRRDEPVLFLKDGTAYSVSDYWVVEDELHFTTMEQAGMKPVQHVVATDQVDWQQTIDVNTAKGFRVVLRNEPLNQYVRDHPNEIPPAATAPKNQ